MSILIIVTSIIAVIIVLVTVAVIISDPSCSHDFGMAVAWLVMTACIMGFLWGGYYKVSSMPAPIFTTEYETTVFNGEILKDKVRIKIIWAQVPYDLDTYKTYLYINDRVGFALMSTSSTDSRPTNLEWEPFEPEEE